MMLSQLQAAKEDGRCLSPSVQSTNGYNTHSYSFQLQGNKTVENVNNFLKWPLTKFLESSDQRMGYTLPIHMLL